MSDNTQRFTGRAEIYERYRQRYPAEKILEHLRGWCGLSPEWTVADIGAGTGMSAEVFLANGNRVIAVEPNAEMRGVCAGLKDRWPLLEVRDGTAEDTLLTDHSVELVTAGRAFHWFDKQRAIAEFRRILRPGGWVALLSLGRAQAGSVPEFTQQAKDFEHLLVTYGTDPTYVWGRYRVHEGMRELFAADARFHQAQLQGRQELEWEAFRGQTMSQSVAPQPGDVKYERFESELRRLFDTCAREGRITVPTTCYLTVAQL